MTDQWKKEDTLISFFKNRTYLQGGETIKPRMAEEEVQVDFTEIECVLQRISADLVGKKGFARSDLKRLALLTGKLNCTYSCGVPLSATFFCGGTIHARAAWHLGTYLPAKAVELCDGTVLTDNEMVNNSNGFHVFFELDYRGSIPTHATMMKHVLLAQELVKEVFPTVDSMAAVSTSEMKLKVSSTTGTNAAAFGVHIVFPNTCTVTSDLKRMAATLDARMTRANHVWSGVVDAASLHSDSTSLRPNFSHKVGACPVDAAKKQAELELSGTAVKRRASHKRQKKSIKQSYANMDAVLFNGLTDDDDDKSDDATVPDCVSTLSSTCGKCWRGMRPLPSTYRLESVVQHNGEVVDYTIDGGMILPVLEELRLTTIVCDSVLTPMELPPPNLLPLDFAESLDVCAPRRGAVFRKEKAVVHAAARRKNNSYLPPTCAVYTLLPKLFMRVHDSYSNLVIQNVMYDLEKKVLTVHVKGVSSRFCVLVGRNHQSNRVFFTVSLSNGFLQAKCFDTDCCKRRQELIPSRRRTSSAPTTSTTGSSSSIDREMRKVLNIKLDDTSWEALCKAVGAPFRNTGYTAKQNLMVSPAVSTLSLTHAPPPPPLMASDDAKVRADTGKRKYNEDDPLRHLSDNPPSSSPSTIKLDSIGGSSTLSDMLKFFDLPAEQRLKCSIDTVFQ